MDSPRALVLVFGDQLNADAAVFDDFDRARDAVWMAEVEEEANPEWSHKLRIVFFLAAMRHFRDGLRRDGVTVHYTELSAESPPGTATTFAERLTADIGRLRPERIRAVTPGDHRVMVAVGQAARAAGRPVEWLADRHFFCSTDDFDRWADGRKALVMETFYRHMRRREGILIDGDGKPVGGEWNYDKENRENFGRAGPRDLPSDPEATPDSTVRDVMRLVRKRYPDNPGSLDHWSLPVTREGALGHLDAFVAERLPLFGRYEDAMWTGEHRLWHSRLSALLNVKLLNPRECVARAVAAHGRGDAPLASVEGFVRQILGWREFIRGVYWREMPDYIRLNALDAGREVPSFLWDGETDMACVRDAMRGVLDHAYAHHIPRLMVLGQICLLGGVHPRRFHDWHMAMYLDAVDWVSLPNTLGMSQYGDGGIVGTKPYCASGKYIDRMSPHCKTCRFDPARATGPDACPFTTLYWDFLARHRERFQANRRMVLQIRNLERLAPDEIKAIREAAEALARAFEPLRGRRM